MSHVALDAPTCEAAAPQVAAEMLPADPPPKTHACCLSQSVSSGTNRRAASWCLTGRRFGCRSAMPAPASKPPARVPASARVA